MPEMKQTTATVGKFFVLSLQVRAAQLVRQSGCLLGRDKKVVMLWSLEKVGEEYGSLLKAGRVSDSCGFSQVSSALVLPRVLTSLRLGHYQAGSSASQIVHVVNICLLYVCILDQFKHKFHLHLVVFDGDFLIGAVDPEGAIWGKRRKYDAVVQV